MLVDLNPIIDIFFRFFAAWWWVFPPFFLWNWFLFHWLIWRQTIWEGQQKSAMLEIIPPPDTQKPFRAMENVFVTIWQAMHDPPDKKEEWLEGKEQRSAAIEIVSEEGKVHFYVKVPKGAAEHVKNAFYAQYTDCEVLEVPDYTKKFPKKIPNDRWKMWGTGYRFDKESVYPIKTYPAFFEERPETKEEKRIDPLSVLLEGMAKIGKGEHIWVQIAIKPILAEEDRNYIKEAEEIVNKMMNRKEPAKPHTFFKDVETVGKVVLAGRGSEEEKKEDQFIDFTALNLTKGERDIIEGIQRKVSSFLFKGMIRFIYFARAENYFSPAKSAPMIFFTQFSTTNLNKLRPDSKSITKVNKFWPWFLNERRAFARKRRLWREYTERVPPFFPLDIPDHGSDKRGTGLFSPEELATIFHLPGKEVLSVSTVSRGEARKTAAPPDLPPGDEEPQ